MEMIDSIVYVLSISMQLTGGIALVLDSFAGIERKVVFGYYGNIRWAISKLEEVDEDDQKEIKSIIFPIFLSRFSFIILIVGTLISPLGSAEGYGKFCIILWIVFATLILNIILFILTSLITERLSKTDTYRKMIVR